MVSAVIMGWVTGFITIQVWLKLTKFRQNNTGIALSAATALNQDINHNTSAESSFLHRMAPEWKILGMIMLCGLIIFLRSFWIYLALASALVFFNGFNQITMVHLWQNPGPHAQFRFLYPDFFLFPIIFSAADSSLPIASLGPLKISEQGLANGSIFCHKNYYAPLGQLSFKRVYNPGRH